MIELIQGDCLEVMHSIPDASVDMILADLPYGTTACKWDTVIDLPSLWTHYKRIIKRNGAIVLTASQPFTTTLIASNMGMFRYTWVWDKVNLYTGFLNAARMPMKSHEDVAVFYSALPTYNPQKRQGTPYVDRKPKQPKQVEHYQMIPPRTSNPSGQMYPGSIIPIAGRQGDNRKVVHPTQKPVALMEYLIRTYTNEGETVLDNTMGSGTTGVACVNTSRHFIGIEKDEGYFHIAQERIAKAQQTPRQAIMEAV